jgi:hypothetical protein
LLGDFLLAVSEILVEFGLLEARVMDVKWIIFLKDIEAMV